MLFNVSSAFAQYVDGDTTCPLTWELTGISPDYTLTFNGEEAMPNYPYPYAPWYRYRESIATAVTGSGVISIGNYAFWNCSVLASATMPSGITAFGIYAFSGCSNLTSITIPSAVTSIGNYAFQLCEVLTSVIMPENLGTVGMYSFEDCSGLTFITIPDNVTSVETRGRRVSLYRQSVHIHRNQRCGISCKLRYNWNY